MLKSASRNFAKKIVSVFWDMGYLPFLLVLRVVFTLCCTSRNRKQEYGLAFAISILLINEIEIDFDIKMTLLSQPAFHELVSIFVDLLFIFVDFLLFEMDFCFTIQKVNVENSKRISALICIQRFVALSAQIMMYFVDCLLT